MASKEDRTEIFRRNLPAYQALKQDSVTAWIDPNGDPHIVPLFLHLNFFANNPDFLPEIARELEAFRNADGDIRMDGQLMAEFMDRIYSEGWGRLGTFGGDKIELDCASDHLRVLRRKAKNIASITQRTFVCNVTEPGQNPKRKHKALARSAYWSSLRTGFVGWLSPSGDIHETATAAPFSTFLDNAALIPEIMKVLEDVESEDRSRQADEFGEQYEAIDPGGHVPWHHYYAVPYNPIDEELDEMTSLVLANGWGRITVANEGIVEMEATDAYQESLSACLARAIEPLGMEISIVANVSETVPHEETGTSRRP